MVGLAKPTPSDREVLTGLVERVKWQRTGAYQRKSQEGGKPCGVARPVFPRSSSTIEQRRGPSPQERGGRAEERRGPPPQAEQRRGPSPPSRGEERRGPGMAQEPRGGAARGLGAGPPQQRGEPRGGAGQSQGPAPGERRQ